MNERRDETRRRVCLGGQIETAAFLPAIPCMVRNVSLAGAQLRVCPAAILPERLMLYVPVRGERRIARLAWREGDKVGLRFDGEAEEPASRQVGPKPSEAARHDALAPAPTKGTLH